mmetsp:Transcript_27477/g.64115  ORF Transcript_27477/g.64115 Transcript_27477/m.64115 type:complete len:233 (-) Transcript_27477:21-719(-)|eukprot:CAMPEP_0178415044 /NCGR_PEP_ID=MMETSP0689_2-20121128/23348_1 /TAXON_ID=160604 /ORGANISM="Amphidinium massartii, Strain CS-259" /LENGTH=232 /DNA_ID=CAMNT_0020036351 /DNA_START=72 /DNA_END=770 /DNA_ORIENTATION=-
MLQKWDSTISNQLRDPVKGFGVAHAAHDTAHEELDRPGAVVILHRCLAGHVVVELQRMAELILRGCNWDVNLVPKHCEGHPAQGWLGKQPAQLLTCLREAGPVGRINKENDSIDVGQVVRPNTAGGLVASQVEGAEANAVDDQLLVVRVQRWLVAAQAVVLQHLEERGLASIVKPEEADLGRLPSKNSQRAEKLSKPVEEATEHRLILLSKKRLSERLAGDTTRLLQREMPL